MKANSDIRTAAKAKKVYLWEIAKHMNISEPTIIRRLRVELPPTEKQTIFNIIDEIATAKENAAHGTTNTIDG